MWTRVPESDLEVGLHMQPTRVVLARDASPKEYRTYLETFHKDGMRYSPEGQPLSGSLMGYMLPRADQMPDFTLDTLETPSP